MKKIEETEDYATHEAVIKDFKATAENIINGKVPFILLTFDDIAVEAITSTNGLNMLYACATLLDDLLSEEMREVVIPLTIIKSIIDRVELAQEAIKKAAN